MLASVSYKALIVLLEDGRSAEAAEGWHSGRLTDSEGERRKGSEGPTASVCAITHSFSSAASLTSTLLSHHHSVPKRTWDTTVVRSFHSADRRADHVCCPHLETVRTPPAPSTTSQHTATTSQHTAPNTHSPDSRHLGIISQRAQTSVAPLCRMKH